MSGEGVFTVSNQIKATSDKSKMHNILYQEHGQSGRVEVLRF